MMSESITPQTIKSDTVLADLDNHFRVFAGPGAGKTYWLICHIKNVLRNSKCLTSASKIACITYTTVASEQIREKLKESGDRVEISTIHSFLYKNVVKPYAHLLKDENGDHLIKYDELDGHEEHKPSFGKVKKWIENPEILSDKYKFLLYDKDKKDKFFKNLSALNWELDELGKCKLCLKATKRKMPPLLLEKAEAYKKLYWEEGRIHHEDVLYFSYRLLEGHPLIREFISSRYPYIFIDEFQDTNPIQTKIMIWLANTGSIIGVIGDKAQSIYSFQGAKREDFDQFKLPNQIDYQIKDNRRSTQKIINLLNYMRKDDPLEQKCIRDIKGNAVCIVVSNNAKDILSFFREQTKTQRKDGEKCIVSRSNDYVAKLKSQDDKITNDIWGEFSTIDYYRERTFNKIFLSTSYVSQGRYEIAVKELLEIFRTTKDGYIKNDDVLKGSIESDIDKRIIVTTLLENLVTHQEEMNNDTFLNMYIRIRDMLQNFDINLKGVNKGKFKDFAEKTIVRDMFNSLTIPENKSDIRTIHGAKGAEFESTLICLGDEKELKHILMPKIDAIDEECRIYYVAASRAKDLLYISVPTLSGSNKIRAGKLGINIINI
jgi:DNA helicase-2/ATP-dependent DNA helicase PcrA